MVGGSILLIHLEDTNARWDNVSGEVVDKGQVMIQKGVIGHEGVKVRARKYGDLPAYAVEIGGDGILLATTFVLCNIDVVESSRAGSRGDAEDNACSWMQSLGGGVV